eukprot:7484218-Karenia_brevis.AAC.1
MSVGRLWLLRKSRRQVSKLCVDLLSTVFAPVMIPIATRLAPNVGITNMFVFERTCILFATAPSLSLSL